MSRRRFQDPRILDFCARMCTYSRMRFEWDSAKAATNLEKHGIAFPDAALALEDDLALTTRDASSEEEERQITLGRDPLGRLLVVVYTWRGEAIRLISARKATPRETRQYES